MSAPGWYWAFLAVNVALGAFSQLLPLYAYFLGAGAGEVGLLAAVGSATHIVASLFWGKFADLSARRRPLVLLGFWGVAACYALLAFLARRGALFPLNAGATFLWMAAGTAATLLVLSAFPRERWEREIGRFNAFGGVGWTAGLILGAVWTTLLARFVGEGWGLRSLALLLALVAGLSGLLALRSLPEPRAQGRAGFWDWTLGLGTYVVERLRYGPTYLLEALSPRQLLRFLQGRTAFGPELVLCYYGELLSFVGFALVFAPFPVFLRQKLGWPNELVFALYVAHHALGIFAYDWARRAIAGWGHRPALAFALLVRVGIFAGFAAVGRGATPWLLPLLFALAGITWSFFQLATTALVSRLAPAELRGQSLGLYNAVAGLGNVIGAALGGYLADAFGYAAPFLSGAALLFLTLPIFLVEGRPSP
ncbi:MAG: MFS transporter [Candidatus Bipolaricaulota bacterium]|nr:MFS transporter [Candidatus Bipolaricaulota bacterium]MCX7844529.1 MFS transporter [Candidatus Bipolaricaulota bacterium]MDW8152382.1 MFS transporter [Candidatus Bipolaricaulota bacterium]